MSQREPDLGGKCTTCIPCSNGSGKQCATCECAKPVTICNLSAVCFVACGEGILCEEAAK